MLKFEKEAFYKLEELTKPLGKTIHTLRRWCREGKVPGAKKVEKEWVLPGWGLIELFSKGTKKIKKEK